MANKNYNAWELQQKINEVDNKANVSYVDENIDTINTKITNVNSKIDKKVSDINSSLEEKAKQSEVRLKGDLITLNDCASDMISAIQNGTGTNFELLSIPKNDSVKIEQISSDLFSKSEKSIGKTCVSTSGVANNDAFRGWATPIKNIGEFRIIKCYTNITEETDITCRIMDKTLSEVMYEKVVHCKVGTNIEVTFNFETSININDEFYICIYAPTNTSIVSYGINKSVVNIQSESLSCKGILKTSASDTDFYNLGVNSTILNLVFINIIAKLNDNLVVNAEQLTGNQIQYVAGNTFSICTKLVENDAFRGWLTPIKKTPSFNKILYYSNISDNTTLTCRIMDKTLKNILYESNKEVVKADNVGIYFDFEDLVTIDDEFYVFIYAPTNTISISTGGGERNYSVLSETLSCKAILKTTSGETTFNDLGVKNSNVLGLKFINDTKYVVDGLMIKENQILKGDIDIKKDTLTGYTLPPFIYTCVNDISKDRDYKVDLYLDHMFNSSSIDSDLIFKESGKDYIELSSGIGKNPHTSETHVQTDNVTTINNTFNLESSTHKATITIPQKSVKASVGATKKAFVLCIGDSQTMYGGQGKCNGDTTAYWGYVKQLFEMDKIDNGDTGFDVVMLGSNKFDSWDGMAKREFNINYKGVSRTIKARAEGVGNWSILHHLRWNGYGAFSQTWWDTLGLGDGTGTDYTGTDAQKNLIINTCQNDTTTSPMNVFFDNDKTGTNKFSITKYLERYRTMDDEGNRLTWGDSRIGTLIKNEDALNSVDVCTPTHIILMHGRNTMVSPSVHAELVEEFITECKTQVPNAKIGICLHPDMPGTYFPDKYPEIKNTNTEKHIYNTDRANQFARMTATINKCKDREDENVFLVPCWFTAPTAYGWALEELKNTSSFLGFGNSAYKICGDNYHPSGLAHMGWAYQIYCWIKYTQSLDTE